MSKELELQQHPTVAYGSSIDDPEVTVINVTDGEFKGTIFNYSNVGELGESEETLTYSTDFQLFCYNGEYHDVQPAEEIITKFHETVSKPLMNNILTLAAQEMKEETQKTA
jgi:hypothetical protein